MKISFKRSIFRFLFFLGIFTLALGAHAQIGIGTTIVNPSAELDVVSTTKGLLAPRMTLAQRNLISVPATGLLVFQTDNTPGFYFYNGSSWTSASGTPGVDLTSDQSVDGKKTFISTDGLVATGTFGSGTASSLGAGARMMWYPKKSAFRAGSAGGDEWNDANIGDNSTAMGNMTNAGGEYSTAMGAWTIASAYGATAMGTEGTASGENSTAMGYGTEASGPGSTAMGDNTTASGNISTAMGDNTNASGEVSTAMGKNSTASGEGSTAMGLRTTAKSYFETAIGSNNTDYTPVSTTSINAIDRLFVIGNGDPNGASSDALVMLKNGNTTFSGTVTATVVAPTSDVRLKRNIVPLKNSIEALMQLKPVSYEKKNSLTSTEYNIKENGFIAQELQKVMPTLVVEGTDKDKLLSVNYTAIIPVLTKAIQEQQSVISDQHNEIGDLKKELDELKKMMQQLLNKK